ncbi:MAG: hypothetical protein JNL72_04010 [Flavipsychrobacter sp.]|nr:hypothetical protein [Flavipsychrobacter sp.]
MKKMIMSAMFAFIAIASFDSCKSCKKCHGEIMGVKSPAQEYCGDDLKRIQEQPGIVCE